MYQIYVVLSGGEGRVLKLARSIAVQKQLGHSALPPSSPCPIFTHKYHCRYRAYIVLSSACEEHTEQRRGRDYVYSHSCTDTNGDAGASTWELSKQRQTRLYCFGFIEENKKGYFLFHS